MGRNRAASGWFAAQTRFGAMQVRAIFQAGRAKDPEFVALWEETREWSLVEFRRIFEELGAQFDIWFFESEVEEEGREIVRDLVRQGSGRGWRRRRNRGQDRRETGFD